jgi:hypothetical protein
MYILLLRKCSYVVPRIRTAFQQKKVFASFYDPFGVCLHVSKSSGNETQIALCCDFDFKCIRKDARSA